MLESSLVSYTFDLSRYSNARKNSQYNKSGKVSKITIHHMAGNLSLQSCAKVLKKSKISCNYAIDSNGNIAQLLSENRRSWCSSSRSNDYKAITIEVANSGGAPDWEISSKAYNALIELCVDICKRNGIEKLDYTGTSSGNLTRHNMFASTTCPGPYLQSKFPDIVEKVNTSLSDDAEETERVKATYKVRVNGRWLPAVTDLEDYAGNVGQPIDGFMLKVDKGSVWYQAHLKRENRWAGKVTGYNEEDFENGFAGNYAGDEIDALRIYYRTPNGARYYKQAFYRVSELNENYMPWQEDNSTKDGMDGYAGNANGKKSIDRVQVVICARSEFNGRLYAATKQRGNAKQ